jgi:hypothetical protein
MIKFSFENLDEVKNTYDPKIVRASLFSTIRKLSNQSATQVSKAITSRYNIKARDVKQAMARPRIREQNDVPVGFLIYTGKRISLRKFAKNNGKAPPERSARPRVKSSRGNRYGARVRVMKSRGTHIVPEAFWGKGRAGKEDGAGTWQIFQRMGVPRGDPRYKGDEKLRKLTGPSIAHMARGDEAIAAANKLVRDKADTILAHELEHRILRKAGLR